MEKAQREDTWVGGGEECWRSPTAPALGGFLSAAEFQKLLCWGGGDHGDTELLLTQPPCQHQSHRSVSRSGSGGVEQQETCCSSGRVNQETGGRLLSNKRCWERDLTLPSISDLTQPSISATKRTKQSKPNEREGVILSTGDCAGDRGAWTRAAIANIDDELTVLFCLVQGNPEAFLPRDLRMIKGRDGQESQKAGELLNRLG